VIEPPLAVPAIVIRKLWVTSNNVT